MPVGEIFLAAFLQVLFEKLMSPELLNFARREGLAKKLDKWSKTLSRIEAVLDDTEEKHHTERAVKQWVDDLRDLAYDVEDILDEFATEASLRKLKGGDQASTSKVRNLIPPCCTGLTPSALKISVRLSSKIKEITARFNDIVIQKDQLNLKETADGRPKRRWTPQPSSSVVNEASVYGREKDKEAILQMLLSEKYSDVEAKVSVIPILGMGGIGKTTLAQLVYNDKKVQSFFNLKAWVCVSEDFDVHRVTKTILQSLTSENCDGKDLNLLQVKLKDELSRKKFLIVLDDLWNENYNDWTLLRAPFEVGALGSAIIITTRNQKVSSTMGSIPEYHLQVLSNDECLSLFTQIALGASNFSVHPNLQDIGEKIVERCKGLPLAAKTLGGLLRPTQERNEWEDVLKSKIWDMPEEESKIVPALMLSYYHLPAHLKRCFMYCSILPKDFEFEERQLVLLWMAEGLIQPLEGDKQIEDLGSKYFRDLLSRSFFQQSSTDGSKFLMHDLINDLAQSVARDICFKVEDRIQGINKGKFYENVRHLSYLGDYYDGPKKFEVFSKLTSLRTFLPFMLPEPGECYLTHLVPLQLLPKLKCLRVLSFNGYCISQLPDSIGDLKHLRYLDLSYTRIKGLPESTTTLYNLQTLILEECSCLKELPSKLGNLVNLRHLNILNANNLEGMPPQVGKLTCLQTLSNLIVRKDSCFALKELGSLLHLRGTLIISRLENAIEPRDARDARLIEKPDLTALCLKWSVNVDDSQDETSKFEVLNMLQPNKALKELTISCYGGTKFPTWLKGHSFPHMVLLRIEYCEKCSSLPPVGQLPSLKHLFIKGMASVKNVGDEFYGGSCSQPFESLETLCFENMKKWESWSPKGEFPHLRELSITDCPKLLGKLPNYLPSLQKAVIERCKQLVVSISSFPELCKLQIEQSKGVVCKSKVDFTSLYFDSFSTISNFTCPIERFWTLENLTIRDCVELTPLWSNEVGLLQPLPCLRKMWVFDCKKLVSLVAEEVHEQPQQGMPCTRNGVESVPKAVVYNNTCLESIFINACDSLTHIAIGQLPPTLKMLFIVCCKNMLILLDEDDTSSCSISKSLLKHLSIQGCPSLKSLSSSGELPATLKHLEICNCEKMQALPNCIHNITSLQKLKIERCPGIVSFPEEGFPANLTSLEIRNCNITVSFPEEGFPANLTSLEIRNCNITEALLEWGLHRLTSLQHLAIGGGCPHLESFPEMTLPASLTSLSICNFPNLKCLSSEDFRYLSSLETLRIGWCEKLMSFPDDGLPPSLLDLRIFCCEKFTSFPEGGLPSSLQQLYIANCPLLKKRCKKDQGQEWFKIAHIPRVEIDRRFIYDPEPEEQNQPMHQHRLEYLFNE